jgi:hypothetical protein
MKRLDKRMLTGDGKGVLGWLLTRALLLGVLLSAGAAGSHAGTDEREAARRRVTLRWDIASIVGITLAPGGIASAFADDGSKITITGSGTFLESRIRKGPLAGVSFHVTGGGNWETFDSKGNCTGGGTYKITLLDRFDPAPGTLVGSGFTDLIGELEDGRAGLAVFNVEYSDGTRGTITFSCGLIGTPDAVFEGITASKEFVDYWNRENGKPIFAADQTVFHVVPKRDHD